MRTRIALLIFGWASQATANDHAGPPLKPTPVQQSQLFRDFDEPCRALKDLDSSTLKALQKLEGSGFALRIVARKSNRFEHEYDLAMLVGESHIKQEADQRRGALVLKDFTNYAIETVGLQPAGQRRGVPFEPETFGLGSVADANDPYFRNWTEEDWVRKGSLIGIARGFHWTQSGARRLYALDGPDPEHPETLGDKLLSMREYFGWVPQEKKLPKSFDEMIRTVPDYVRRLETRQREQISRRGKFDVADHTRDVRTKQMAQNLGLIYARSKEPSGPVLAIVGAAHLPGLKHQLLQYQGFQEIPRHALDACLAAR